MQKIRDLPDYVKDEKRGALLNTNNAALLSYRAQKDKLAKINKHEVEIEEIKKDISDIKTMLETIVKALNVS